MRIKSEIGAGGVGGGGIAPLAAAAVAFGACPLVIFNRSCSCCGSIVLTKAGIIYCC